MTGIVTIVTDCVNYSSFEPCDTMEMGRPEDCKTFSARLGWALGHASKDATELRKHLKVSRAAMNHYIGDNPSPSRMMKAAHAAKAAIFLGVSTDWLAAGIGPWQRDYRWREETIAFAGRFEEITDPEQRKKAVSVLDILVAKAKPGDELPSKFHEIEQQRAADKVRREMLVRKLSPGAIFPLDDLSGEEEG